MIEQKIGVVTKREYDFNQVEDLIFEQPDINHYVIQNNV